MDMITENYSCLWPLVIYFIATIGLAAVMIGLSYVLGQRHRESATGEPYESGIASTGTAHIRFDVRYYLIAMFFVIFDLETVFIFAWAVAFKELGWTGYLRITVFILVLLLSLFYVWRKGALDWKTTK